MKRLIFVALSLIGFLAGSATAFAFTEQVNVAWTDAGTEDGYVVERNASACATANANSWSVIANPAADVVTYVDSVSDNATYCYRVKAIKNGVYGPYSAPQEITVPPSLSTIVVSLSLV